MRSTGKLFAVLAAALLLVAVMLGAYTSHGLEGVFEARAIATVQIAVQYQFYHGLGLLAVALLGERIPGRALQATGWLFFVGVLLFCGGIYASTLLGWSAFSRITPLGGSAFIGGWLLLIVAVLRSGAAGARR